MKVALAQIAPVWLDRDRTLAKVMDWVHQAADAGASLVAFGECLLPGYPFWVELTDGARFESTIQKDIFAHYLNQAVSIEQGHLETLCQVAQQRNIAIYLGCAEKGQDRGGHTIYCSMVYIDLNGKIGSVHRKLMPTYEERLVWGIGDGNGLRTHPLQEFMVGGLNCWENWMPLARSSLYAQGENLHVAIWPGNQRNTEDITRFMAREGRSYVLSASAMMNASLVPEDFPHRDLLLGSASQWWANGGSCIAGPDGQWVVPPVVDKETLVVADLDLAAVLRERHNFDAMGHYSRPDVLQLHLNRERQRGLKIHGDV